MLRQEGVVRREFLAQLALLGFAGLAALAGAKAKRRVGKESGNLNAQPLAAVGGADLVLLNGRVWTGEDPSGFAPASTGPGSIVQAVAVVNGRFFAAGTSDEIRACVGPATEVIDLEGRLAVPGFIDSHVHFVEGGFRILQVELKDSRNEEDFVRRLEKKARTVPPERWILGGNWDEENWPSAKLPTRQLIDPVTPNNPVFISRYDGHAALANSSALKLANVSRETPDPPGGVIVRAPATGEPTGVLKDAAIDLVARAIPRPTEAEMEGALKGALAEARRVGITSVQNIAADTETFNGSFTGELQLLRRAELEGWLTTRFYEIVPIAHWKRLGEAGISREMGSDFLKLGAVKGFADGSLGSRTAWMFEPPDDAPSSRGLPMTIMDPPDTMEVLARGSDESSVQLCIHAIGDRAIAEMLDLYARVGGEKVKARRFRIEHAQHLRAADFKRFAELGVIASMQPYHAIDDGRWAEKRIGRARARTSYAWRSLLDAGGVLAFGSDWPVAPLDPLLGVYAAVTRSTLDGKNPGGWFPQEKITVEEALRAYTVGSAFAAFAEMDKGTMARGKLADIVVLSDDLFCIPPEKIKEASVVLTVVGGKVVHRAL
ncbi:MAG: amidohydrolase family protein [Acidobacteria bacterium]|nr:amidohydrolase family protein [Acidobacteriota bacterium]